VTEDRHLLLEADDIAKAYGAVVALRSASLAVRPGEVHALNGRQRRGKSTSSRSLPGFRPASSQGFASPRSHCDTPDPNSPGPARFDGGLVLSDNKQSEEDR